MLERKRASQENLVCQTGMPVTGAGRETENKFLSDGTSHPTFQGFCCLLPFLKLCKKPKSRGTFTCLNRKQFVKVAQSKTRDWKNNSSRANSYIPSTDKITLIFYIGEMARDPRTCCTSVIFYDHSLEPT